AAIGLLLGEKRQACGVVDDGKRPGARLDRLESRIANAADQALTIELEALDRMTAAVVAEAEAIKSGARAQALNDGDAGQA
ncbi:hypothetical protein, partial [Rhizobium leguminosarum]|uniref:hypothetical protein n=1 Tax=Rhizobium leguminosarum TaxID=384 RepID=UPI003F9E3928